MDRQRAKELLPIIEAFANGEDIEIECGVGWIGAAEQIDLSNRVIAASEYRIKPKPREFVLEMNTDGTVRNILEAGEAPWFDNAVHIKVREVV